MVLFNFDILFQTTDVQWSLRKKSQDKLEASEN